MINKLIGQMSTDVVNFFAKYGIDITAQYTPELPGIITYGRNFLTRTLANSPVSINGHLYQNKLLYRVATPKPAEYAPHNNLLSVTSGMEVLSQNYIIESVGNSISKIRLPKTVGGNLDDGLTKVRDMSLLEIPVEFSFITDSLNLVFSISTLFYQQLVNLNLLEVGLDLFNNGTQSILPYFLNWDRSSLEISYANFENTNTLNTISFNLLISGAVFSEFYTEEHVINRYDISIGTIT